MVNACFFTGEAVFGDTLDMVIVRASEYVKPTFVAVVESSFYVTVITELEAPFSYAGAVKMRLVAETVLKDLVGTTTSPILTSNLPSCSEFKGKPVPVRVICVPP
jgi:hypothetical protein